MAKKPRGFSISKPEEPEELVTARRMKAMLYNQCGGNIALLDEVSLDLLDSLNAWIKRFSKSPENIS